MKNGKRNGVRGRYTGLSNRIGLFVDQMGKVVLSFPFKDCILEAGMTKEEKNGGREERFFCGEVDEYEIDALRDKKVLTNFSVVDKKGEKKCKAEKDIEFFDEEGNLKNNLLIKGNNLMSLYSLREKFGGKIKMVYIDPPYNTGNDTFNYNDKFDHSSWLVFMQNRLEVAKELLRDDGVIFISCDDSEQAYLKILCDEIFGRERCEVYIWNLIDFEETSFTKTASSTVRREHEYVIACFSSNDKSLTRYKEYRFTDRDDFSNQDDDPRGEWMSGNISRNAIKTTTGSKYFTIKTPSGNEYTRNWTVSKKEFEELKKDNRIYFSKNGKGVPRMKIFKNEPSWNIQSSILSGLKTSVTGKNQLRSVIGSKGDTFPFPKPINLIQRLINIAMSKDDIILDFFAGSGTTGHAALALNAEDGGNRKFILCEQIDEHFDICKDRLQKLLKNGKKHIGKSLDEKVVSFELKQYNQLYLDQIDRAKTKKALDEVYRDMQKNAFLQFWFDRKEFESNGYKKMTLVEQKEALRGILDLNQLYLNYPEIEDKTYKVAPLDKQLTNKFYA